MRRATLTKRDLLRVSDVPTRALRETELATKRRLFRFEDASVRAVHQAYRAAFADIRASAVGMADTYGIRKVERNRDGLTWQRAVMERVRTRLLSMSAGLAEDGLKRATAAFQFGYLAQAWQLDMATDASVRVNVPRIDTTATARQLATTFRENVYRDIIASELGLPWRRQYDAQIERLIADIELAISSGMSAGEGIDLIIMRVQDTMGAGSTFAPRASYSRLETVTRTVVNAASNNGAWNAYQRNADILQGYQWLAARDERVCPTCAALNGTFYTLEDTYRPPAHARCRCTIIPVVRVDMRTPNDTGVRTTFSNWLLGTVFALAFDDAFTAFAGEFGL